MKMFRRPTLLALATSLLLTGAANAGPIHWYMEAGGGGSEDFSLFPVSGAFPTYDFTSLPGETVTVYPIAEWKYRGSLDGDFPDLPGGKVETAIWLTLRDGSTHIGTWFEFPFYVYQTETWYTLGTDPEYYKDIHHQGNVYRFQGTGIGMDGINVTVNPESIETPEPTTLVLAGIGIGGACLFRKIRRRVGK